MLDDRPPIGHWLMRAAGVIRVGLLALIWGSGFLLIKISLRSFSPVQLTFGRLALGALVLVVFLAVRGLKLPNQRRLWLYLVIAALLGNAVRTRCSAWPSRR